MKSRMRSRRVSTWGLGVKSIDCVLSSGLGRPNASGRRLPPPVAGEELAVLLEQPGQLQLGHAGQLVALEDAGRFGAGHPRGGGEEELVDEALPPELAVEVRAALAEQG